MRRSRPLRNGAGLGLTLRVALAGGRRRCAALSNRLFVCRQYEWHDDSQQWYRSYGNENWEFNEQGFMMRRFASINVLPIQPEDRKFFWPLGRRPDDHPGLSQLGL